MTTANLAFDIPTTDPNARTAGPLYAQMIDDALQKIDDASARSVRAKGATGDGSSDDFTPIDDVMAGGGPILFAPGTYATSQGLVATLDNTVLMALVPFTATIKARDGANFQQLLYAENLTGVGAYGLIFDVNQANRSGVMTTQANGVKFSSCTYAFVLMCITKNTLGFGTTSATAFQFAFCTYSTFSLSRAIDCGQPGLASDGFYNSGTQNLTVGCIAEACLDTGFVLEACQSSGIVGCTANNCGAVGAITTFGSTTAIGNYISGLTGSNFNASVSGGIQIASLGTGNLVDTTVSNVTLSTGTGPAINVRNTSTGRITGLTLSGPIRISAPSLQGILVSGVDGGSISGFHISSAGTSAIQIQSGCTDIKVHGGKVHTLGSIALQQTSSTDIHWSNINITGVPGTLNWGLYGFGTSTGMRVDRATVRCITSPAFGTIGSDSGTVVDRLTRSAGVVVDTTLQTLSADGAVTVDASKSAYQIVTLAANASSTTITNPTTNQILTLAWIQDGTGSRTYAWPSNCKFAGAAAPSASTVANRRDIVTFRYDGTNWIEQYRSINVG